MINQSSSIDQIFYYINQILGYFEKIVPYLIPMMLFLIPIVSKIGEFFRGIIVPLADLMPEEKLWIFILVAILIFGIGGFLNYKYPYRPRVAKEDDGPVYNKP